MTEPVSLPTGSRGHGGGYGLSCGEDACGALQWYYTADWLAQPLLVTWTAAAGLKAVPAPLPSGAAAVNDGSDGNRWGTGATTASCGSAVCALASTYRDVGNNIRLAVWTWNNGRWGLTLPSTPPGWKLQDAYNQVGCGSGVCGLFSYYDDGAGITNSMIVWTWTTNGWDGGTRNPAPAGTGNYSGVLEVACATFCLAPGYYGDSSGTYHPVIWTWSSGKGWRSQSPTAAGLRGPLGYNRVSCGRTVCGVAGSTTGSDASAVFWTSQDGVTLTADSGVGDPYRATANGYGAFISCGGTHCAAWAGKPLSDLTQAKGELLFFNGSSWSASAPLPTPTNAVAGTSAVAWMVSCGTAVCSISGGYAITTSQTNGGPFEGLVWSRYDPA